MQAQDITAVVLCGGSGTRLGGTQKPLTQVGDRSLVEHVIAALTPQVGGFVLSCGRDATPYQALGYLAIADARPGDGPLGGIVSAFPEVETDWILTHPADVPFPDASLVVRLSAAAEANGVAVPRAGGYRQNLVLLLSRARADEVARFYREGGRAVKDWLDAEMIESLDLTGVADSFFNVNTAADLAIAEERLARRR